MTVPDSAVFDATCSQVFTGRHGEFTFSNDTVTARDPDLWRDREADSRAREQIAARAAKSLLACTFRGAVVVAL
jgi:hypothetical protein